MSKFSIVTGMVSFALMFAVILAFEVSITLSIILTVLCVLFGIPAIVENEAIEDTEYERRVVDELR